MVIVLDEQLNWHKCAQFTLPQTNRTEGLL